MLLNVEEVKRDFFQCREIAQTGSTERVVNRLEELIQKARRKKINLEDYMVHAISLRGIECILGRREADEEFKFICPKKLLTPEMEKKLEDGGWFTGHWFRNMDNGEILVEISYK